MPSNHPENPVPLCEPVISGNAWHYVKHCLDTGYVAAAGDYVNRFESDLARRLERRHAVATVNGTAALHIALLTAGVTTGDEVVMPTLTFIAPANAVRYVGAYPVFVDAEANNWQMDVDQLEYFLKACVPTADGLRNPRSGRYVKAILPVHMLGHPTDIDAVMALAAEYGLVVIEDATEGLGGRCRGHELGRKGHISCLSFNGNKMITSGGGGMLLTDNDDWAGQARYLINQAKDDAVEYIHSTVGYNYRLTNLQGALGCAQLEQLDEHIAAKRRVATTYHQLLADIPGITPIREASWAESAWWMYAVRVDSSRLSIDSRKLHAYLSQRAIQSRPLWQPLHRSPAYTGMESIAGTVAETLFRQVLCLPCSVNLSADDQRLVVQHIRDVARLRGATNSEMKPCLY